ncbi:MAG TPA: HRDC domain-containing protein [Thermoleophilaceae bacterium]|nr:HRDC domain-containing protein [Thermoleophilaceae bacterium]
MGITSATTTVTELAEQARRDGRFGLDTEFVSERRYQPLLCLVQIVVGDRIEILDPLADLDAGPLAEVLADPAIEVVLHAGRQDVALLRRSWNTEIRNVLDTQVAAGFAGYGAQSGYDSLVRSLLGVPAKGAEGFSRWERRPLTPEQIEYARADVEHLLPMADALKERLRASGRLEWAREECLALERATDERSPADQFLRLPRVRRLSKRQRAVALTLVEWRQGLAREIDRPASAVLPDHVLVEVARRQPDDRRALEEVRGMPAQTLQRWQRDLIAAVARGREAPDAPALPEIEQGDSGDAPLVALGQALVRQRALEAKVAVDLVATQSDIAALVGALRRDTGRSGIRTLQGWRRELVGDELVRLLSGDYVVRVRDRQLTVEPGD